MVTAVAMTAESDPAGQPTRPLSVLIAGGGTAGHIEPAMNTADALRALQPDIRIVALGTPKGLENTLVPQRGYELALVPPVPLPRKPSLDLVKLPGRLRSAVKQTRAILDERDVQVVIGFGGYVCLPAYLAARGRVPIVVHEANARAGLANKVGARFAARVLAAVAGSGLSRAEVVGIPVRSTIAGLDRAALRAEARAFFGLDPDAPTLLAFGGSQGAVRINDAVSDAADRFAAAGVGVLHAFGRKNAVTVDQMPGAPPYVALPYVDRMDLAYAAADLALGRSGAMTVAELGAVGLPAVYVPASARQRRATAQCRRAARGRVGHRDRRRRPHRRGDRIHGDPAARRPRTARRHGRRRGPHGQAGRRRRRSPGS